MELLPQISRFSNRVKTAPPPPPPMVLRPKFAFAPAAATPAPAAPPLGLPPAVPLVTTPGPADVLPLILNGVGRVPSSFISWAGVVANIPIPAPPAAGGEIVHDVDCRTSSPTVTLPAAPADGEVHIVKDAYGAALSHQPVVTTVGGVLIDGSTSFPSAGLWQDWASFGFRWSAALGKWLVQ